MVFAVAALEGWLNELLELALEKPGSRAFGQLAGSAKDLSGRNVSLALKLQVGFTLIAGHPLDRGAQPYQDFDLLVSIRNALIHMRSETMQYGPGGSTELVQHALAKRLVAGKIIDTPSAAMLPLMSAVNDARVGAWAYQTAVAVARAVIDAMGDGDDKMSMRIRAGLGTAEEFNESVA